MKNFLKSVIIVAGIAMGPALVAIVFELVKSLGNLEPYALLTFVQKVVIFVGSGIIAGAVALLFADRLATAIVNFAHRAEKRVTESPSHTVLYGAGGLLFGLVAAFLLSGLIDTIETPFIAVPIKIILYSVCASVSLAAAVKLSARRNAQDRGGAPKYLDTSVIIDGRIYDILKTGVIEGEIVIPQFVLDELRHVADSADPLRRAKGRRGLDILGRIQKELDMPVRLSEEADTAGVEVDAHLLSIARENGGTVITNDYNLNKVAAVQGVKILNINELANAVKPVVLPGEEMRAGIVKKGREDGQGVAFLSDGTMIVVQDAEGPHRKREWT